MRKPHHLLSVLLAVPVLFSCQEGENEGVEVSITPQVAVIHAQLEQAAATKTYMNESYKVFWNAGDKISVFAKNDQNCSFSFAGNTGDKSGDFTNDQPGSQQNFSLSKYYSAYPWRSGNSISQDGKMSLEIPAAQKYTSGSYDPDAAVMVAVSETPTLNFKNVGACIGFNLYGQNTKVKSISVRGKHSEPIAGKIVVTAGDEPTMVFDQNGQADEITLTAEQAVTLSPTVPTVFWIAIAPASLPDGLTLTVTDGEGKFFHKDMDKSINIQRKHAVRMSAVEVVYQNIIAGVFTANLDYYYEPGADQISVYEAEGSVWSRFINPTSLRIIEIGPIPSSITVGNSFNTTVSESISGVLQSSVDYQMTINSITNGYIDATSGNSRFIFRY